jgi:hypothetical protein
MQWQSRRAWIENDCQPPVTDVGDINCHLRHIRAGVWPIKFRGSPSEIHGLKKQMRLTSEEKEKLI